jgi:hypothetical protein
MNKRTRAPRTAAEFFARSEEFQENWDLATQVVSKMRANKWSLAVASQELGIDPRVVVQLAGSALRKNTKGRYVARPSDRLLRVLILPTPDGLREVATSDSQEATKVGDYWNAVYRQLYPGDDGALRKFRNQYVTAQDGERVPLLTDPDQIDLLGSAGVFSFETIYARSA